MLSINSLIKPLSPVLMPIKMFFNVKAGRQLHSILVSDESSGPLSGRTTRHPYQASESAMGLSNADADTELRWAALHSTHPRGGVMGGTNQCSWSSQRRTRCLFGVCTTQHPPLTTSANHNVNVPPIVDQSDCPVSCSDKFQ